MFAPTANVASKPLQRPIPVASEVERRWVTTDDNVDSPGISVTVMSYNVLAQNYVSSRIFPATDRRFLRAPYRRRAIVEELRRLAVAHEVDVICVQELQVEECAGLAKELPDFDGVSYKQRTSAGVRGKQDGCGVLWRTDRFEHVRNVSDVGQIVDDHVEFNDISNDPSLVQMCGVVKELALRNCVGALVRLQERETGLKLVVGSAHLFWNPEFAKLKLAQAGVYRRAAFAVAESFGTKHVVLAGDWNSLPGSAVYAFLTDQVVDNTFSELHDCDRELLKAVCKRTEWDDCGLVSSFRHENFQDCDLESNAPLTTLTPKFRGALDHIFYSKFQGRGQGNTVLGYLSLPCATDFVDAKIVALPSEAHPSDHLPHIARIHLEDAA
jgi:CCR4-NOT transcription complex subunit 6